MNRANLDFIRLTPSHGSRQISSAVISEPVRLPCSVFVGILGAVILGAAVVHATPVVFHLSNDEKTQLQREARLAVDLIENNHYSGDTFHDINNAEVINRILADLDPRADIFGPPDLAFLHRKYDRTLKTIYLFRGDLEPAFEIFGIYLELARKRLAWADARLRGEFNFNLAGTYLEVADGVLPPSPSLDERWNQRLKDEMIAEIVQGRSVAEARAQLRKHYAGVVRSLDAIDSFIVRERYLDGALRSFDPHSAYFSADSNREFSLEAEGAVTGLGLEVERQRGECLVRAVELGSPADLNSPLAPGDRIEALADGEGPWVETARLRMREIRSILVGGVGGNVGIAYRPAGGTQREEVTLVRAPVVLTDVRARGGISQVPAGRGNVRPIAWIRLPAFYGGQAGAGAASAAADVRVLLDAMARDGIEGLVMDLRGNSGGALTEAIALSELFLSSGPVVLGRNTSGVLIEHAAKNQPAVYSGPLVILTSGTTAAAAEIFAAAMKVNHRAFIVGAPATFGKGTSQSYLDLARALNLDGASARDWGTLRLTTERFYSPDGAAIQGAGVTSHATFPISEPRALQRESELPNALLAENVTPPPASRLLRREPFALSDDLCKVLVARVAANIDTLPEWRFWLRAQTERAAQRGRKGRSLLLSVRQQEWDTEHFARADALRWRTQSSATVGYPTKPFDLPEVAAALNAHRRKLRESEASPAAPDFFALDNSVFRIRTDQRQLLQVSFRTLDFDSYIGASPAIAAAVTATGISTSNSQVRAILQSLARLEEKTSANILAEVRRSFSPAGDDSKSAALLAAILREIIKLDPEFADERARFDIPLRESQRACAAWVDQLTRVMP